MRLILASHGALVPTAFDKSRIFVFFFLVKQGKGDPQAIPGAEG